MLRPGDMRHRIAFLAPPTTQDDAGASYGAWTTHATRWAAVERTPGSEIVAAAQRQTRVPVVFSLYNLATVTAAMRVSWDGKLHNIVSVTRSPNLKEMRVACEEFSES